MRFRKLAVGLCVVTVMNTATPTVKVFADEVNTSIKSMKSYTETRVNKFVGLESTKLSQYDELYKIDKSNIESIGPIEHAEALVENEKVVATEAKIKLFEAYDNKEYNDVFKMDNSNIESIKNNAGHNVGKYLSNAIDEDINTEWASNKVNSDTFKNEVELVFKEKVELDRVVYGARQSDSKGFAEEFEIYGSKTTSGDTYELIATGKYNPVKGLIEAKFDSTQFKRMKFKFTKGKDNWATISEIAFYKEDAVSQKMDRLFTDDTLSVVSEEFNSIEKIQVLENEAKSHPLYELYKEKIGDAKILLSNEQIEATKALTSQFELYENSAYNEMFQIDKSNIKSIKNNAGHYSSQVISNAIDGDVNTYWETNKGNNSSFNNEVEIEFKEKVLIDRIVYGARQSDTKGFAEEFEIYASKTTSGDTYQLIINVFIWI
ncbi:MAG: discoidin domain-containing protein [Peptostreptococcaceae bacterium]